jgi:hypothetical protein
VDTVKKMPKNESYYREAGSYASKRETDPPAYVRHFGRLGTTKKTWLQLGIESRERVEFRYNDVRRPESKNRDTPILWRQKAYVGIQNVLDPFRLGIEVGDSWRTNGVYPLDNRDVNRSEIIQAYAELYLVNFLKTDAQGNKRPLSIRYGRQAFEMLDRRLISLNPWRNTTGNFEGLRVAIGQDRNDWQIDAMVLRPVNIQVNRLDGADRNRLFTAVIGHWRKWSELISLEPYYMNLKQDANQANNLKDRNIHTLGLRTYGLLFAKSLQFDISTNYQFGNDNGQLQHAFSINAELGHIFKNNKHQPRMSTFFGYASGDKNPNDGQNNRFERYFGFSRPWSADDYITMENIFTPKIKIEWQGKMDKKIIRFDAGYSLYWLASKTDRMANLLAGSVLYRDKNGLSGQFLGEGIDSRMRFNPIHYVSCTIGYSYFSMGDFIRNRQVVANTISAKNSHFLYLELTINPFDIQKKIKK